MDPANPSLAPRYQQSAERAQARCPKATPGDPATVGDADCITGGCSGPRRFNAKLSRSIVMSPRAIIRRGNATKSWGWNLRAGQQERVACRLFAAATRWQRLWALPHPAHFWVQCSAPLETEHFRPYDEACAGRPGNRCLALVPTRSEQDHRRQGWGRGKSELRRAVCSLTARVAGGCPQTDRTPAIRKVPQKTYRRHSGLGRVGT